MLEVPDKPLVPEILPANDHLLMRFRSICGKMTEFYEFIAYKPKEEVEKELREFPATWEARLKIAPILFSRILPVRSSVQHEAPPKRGITPGQLRDLGFSVEQLKRLAQLEDKAETEAQLVPPQGQNGNAEPTS